LHFGCHYELGRNHFKCESDPLVLLIHWCMIENTFKCVIDDDQCVDFLPANWNVLKNDETDNDFISACYSLNYRKNGHNYFLQCRTKKDSSTTKEKGDQLLHIQFKRVNDSMSCAQTVRISEFINTKTFKNQSDYRQVYIDMGILCRLMHACLSQFCKMLVAPKKKRPVDPEAEGVAKKAEQKSQQRPTTALTRLHFSPVKKEKWTEHRTELEQSMSEHPRLRNAVVDSQMRVDERGCASSTDTAVASCVSTASSVNPTLNGKAPAAASDGLKQKVGRKGKVPKFEENPLTNYFSYNRHVCSTSHIDSKQIDEDEWVKEQFDKFGLKLAEIPVMDCLKTSVFTGLTIPIHLTLRMKDNLDLLSDDDDDDNENKEINENNQSNIEKKGSISRISGKFGRKKRGQKKKIDVKKKEKPASNRKISHLMCQQQQQHPIPSPPIRLPFRAAVAKV